jgi:hypothetical protein
MNLAGPFIPSGEGEWNMIMIVVDKLTKHVHFIPCKSMDKAPDTAHRFIVNVVSFTGCQAP